MNKQLNEDSIVNELKGSSFFFKKETQDAGDKEKNRVSSPVAPLPGLQPDKTMFPTPASQSAAQEASQVRTEPTQSTVRTPSPSKVPSPDNSPTGSHSEKGEISPPKPPTPSAVTSPHENRTAEQLEQDVINRAGADASQNASMLARDRARLVEEIRKTVKSYGKEVSYVRLTPEEKDLLANITYTYKRQGVKTSENEINRIAVNLLLADFKANGEASILNRVIEALLA